MVLSGRQFIPTLLIVGAVLAIPAIGEATGRSFLPRLRSSEPAAKESTGRRPGDAPAQQQTYQGPLVEIRNQPELQTLVDEAIEKTSKRYLDAEQYTPWQIMHGMFALRENYQVTYKGKLIRGVDYLSDGPTFRGEAWFEKTPYGGRAHPFSVPYAFEGHVNQFPALLAMTALPASHQFKVQGGTITMADIVRNAQMTVNSNEEISWTLWFLTQYLNQDAEWKNAQGHNWSMQELVRIQNADPVYNAPCGGCHGLYAIAFARNSYIKQNGRLGGVWLESDYKLRQHIELARQLQNGDGSFSTNWFKGRGYSTAFEDRIKTSGHMLEWLMMALPQSRLNEDWVRRAVQMVATDLIRSAAEPAECGAMYHALHSLVLYNERMNPESKPSQPDSTQIAKTTKPTIAPAPNAVPTPSVVKPGPETPSATPETTIPATTTEQTPAMVAQSNPLNPNVPTGTPAVVPNPNAVIPPPPGTLTPGTLTSSQPMPMATGAGVTPTTPAVAGATPMTTPAVSRPPLILADPEFTPEPSVKPSGTPGSTTPGTATAGPPANPATANIVPTVPMNPEIRAGESTPKTATIGEPMVSVATPQRVAALDPPSRSNQPITPSFAADPIVPATPVVPLLIEERPNAKPVILESPSAPRRLDGTPSGRPAADPVPPLIDG